MWAPAGPWRSDGRQSGVPTPPGRHPGRRPQFFDWINAGKLSYCVDFDRQADELRALLAVADVVIEGSRPAALARRRLGPDDLPPRAGRIWLRITGYEGCSGRPAFGDDAAVAGGLVGGSADDPVFCGDAIADPLTGLEATRAVNQSLGRGGGELIEVSMAAVAATYAALPTVPNWLTRPRHRRRPGGRAGVRARRRQRRRTAPGRRKTLPIMLIRRATLLDGTVTDIRVGAQIDEVGDDLAVRPGEGMLDAGGGTVLPGLHDHHVHIRSAASALYSFSVGPPGGEHQRRTGTDALERHPGPRRVDPRRRLSRVGGRDLDRTALDAVVPHIPVRIQHRSGALWILNTAALGRVGLPEHPDGRLRSADRGWSEALARRETDLAEFGRRITATGVTGVTDATPDLDADDMVALMVAHRRGEFRPRPHFLAPGKIILHDDRLDLDALIDWITLRHNDGRAGGGALRHHGPTRRDHRGAAGRGRSSARPHRARRAGAR